MKTGHFLASAGSILLLALLVTCDLSTRSLARTLRGERSRWTRRREQLMQRLERGESGECCPTLSTITAPLVARGSHGAALELYRAPNITQLFHERTCADYVANKPCRYVEKNLRKFSRCVQQKSLEYAIVRDYDTNEEFRMDFVQVNTGCSCKIDPQSDLHPS